MPFRSQRGRIKDQSSEDISGPKHNQDNGYRHGKALNVQGRADNIQFKTEK